MEPPQRIVIANSALYRIIYLVLAYIMLIASGCRPSARPSADQPAPEDKGQDNKAARQPTEAEFAAFLRSTLGPFVRLGDLKTDPPVPMPNTSPDSNVWLVNVKLTLGPVNTTCQWRAFRAGCGDGTQPRTV